MAGSLNDENSLTLPTGELFRSVVRRRSGKSAKRIKGTESSAPTNTEPTPSSAPRKERRFWREGSPVDDLLPTTSEFSAYISTPSHLEVYENNRPRQIPKHLFFRQRPDIRHQLRNVVSFQFFPERGHLPLTVGDQCRELRVRLFL